MKRAGFTLIELSIVLVIIGLIIGGVLVGRDLIKAAEIRATIGQKEKFDAAVLAFKLKYGALPGDMAPSLATTLGFYALSETCGGTCTLYRFGNGVIDFSSNGVTYQEETFAAWRHLGEASLIEGQYSGQASVAVDRPKAKLGSSSAQWAFNVPLIYENTAGNSITPSWAGMYSLQGVSPAEAFAIDSKLDDGKPNTGNARESEGAADNGTWNATAATGYCTYGGSAMYAADASYIVDASIANSRVCRLDFKSGF